MLELFSNFSSRQQLSLKTSPGPLVQAPVHCGSPLWTHLLSLTRVCLLITQAKAAMVQVYRRESKILVTRFRHPIACFTVVVSTLPTLYARHHSLPSGLSLLILFIRCDVTKNRPTRNYKLLTRGMRSDPPLLSAKENSFLTLYCWFYNRCGHSTIILYHLLSSFFSDTHFELPKRTSANIHWVPLFNPK